MRSFSFRSHRCDVALYFCTRFSPRNGRNLPEWRHEEDRSCSVVTIAQYRDQESGILEDLHHINALLHTLA